MAKGSVRHIIAGDVVKLNSGGPSMTVERVLGDEVSNRRIRCVWMDITGQMNPQHAEFYESCVTRVQGLK